MSRCSVQISSISFLYLFLQNATAGESTSAQAAVNESAQGSTSTIELKSTPDGAEISVDGKYVGNSPSTLHLPAGDHLIKFEKAGYKSWERTLNITPGEMTTISVTLEKQESPAS